MRPYVITHMGMSIDGRIVTKNWGKVKGIEQYERIHKSFKSNAWMVGRVTMELHFAKGKVSKLKPAIAKIDRNDFVAFHDVDSYAIAVDESGKLQYKSSTLDGDHLIVILAEKVSDDYLQFLRKKNISYVFGGKYDVDFKIVFEKLGKLFPIKKILLEGGGGINGSVLNAKLVDEISVLQFPVVDGTPGTPAMFDIVSKIKRQAVKLKLISVKRIPNGILWLRYKVRG